MYAARRRQKSVRGKFQFSKLRIGQQLQLFDNPLRQFPQGGFIGHQVALHEPQFVNFIINNPPVILRNVSIRTKRIVVAHDTLPLKAQKRQPPIEGSWRSISARLWVAKRNDYAGLFAVWSTAADRLF